MAVAVAAALFIAFEWLGGDAGMSAPPAAPPPATAARDGALAVPAPAPQSRASAVADPGPAPAAGEAKALPSSAELARKFNSAVSLRAFVYDALKKPEEGGYQYAFAALELCKFDGTTLRLPVTATAQQKDAYEALSRRCDMSAADREAARAQIAADRSASYNRDPYLALAFDRIAAINAPAMHSVVAAILGSGDPLALQYLATEVSYMQDGVPMMGVYFGGRHYPYSGMFEHAIMLAVCSLGIDCGPSSSILLMMCVHKGWCGDSMQGAIRNGLGAQQAAQAAQIEALAARLVVEIRRKNVGAFVPG